MSKKKSLTIDHPCPRCGNPLQFRPKINPDGKSEPGRLSGFCSCYRLGALLEIDDVKAPVEGAEDGEIVG